VSRNHLSRLLVPLSGVYGVLMRLRNRRYDRSQAAVRRVEIPVISVGNITVGGTGKTPMVMEVVRRLGVWGLRPAVLTRGYRAGVRTQADEVCELQDALPGVPVVVDPDRVAGAAAAQREHGADCVVLDDGFQHRRLARDLDIVLIDALRPWGGGHVLPAGRLREPLNGLKRADVLIVTRANQVVPEVLERITGKLRELAGEQPILPAAVEPQALVDLNGQLLPATALSGRRVLPVCGIGNPATFEKLVSELADGCLPLLAFSDHHRYRPGDVARIEARSAELGAAEVVTTRKDWAKLAGIWTSSELPLLRLDVRLTLSGPVAEFEARLRAALERSD
jgi:tetraacyldisaccharide 4'-kinase